MPETTPTQNPTQSEPQAVTVAGPPRPELQRFLTDLLSIQCELIGAVGAVAFLSSGAERSLGLAAKHATAAEADSLLGLLFPAIEKAAGDLVQERSALEAANRPLVHGRVDYATRPTKRTGLYGAQPQHRLVTTPLVAEGVTRGAAVLVFGPSATDGRGVPVASGPEDDQALSLLALTNARLEAFLWREHAMQEAEQKLKLRETLELLDASQQGTDAGSMGALFCHELKRRFGCTRVSICLERHGRMRVVAISGVDQLDKNSLVVQSIEDVAEECADQDIEIIFPATTDVSSDLTLRRVTRSHDEHSRKHGPASLLSLPLRVERDLVGVALLERAANDPFPPGAASLVRLVAEYIGPALWTRRLADRGIMLVTRDRTLELGRTLVGPTHTAAKLVASLVLLVFVLMAVIPTPRRISANFEARAAVSRTIVPPFGGYLDEVLTKPGDAVKVGQTIARMDTREAEQQLAVEQAKRDQLRVQRDEAQSQGELAKQRMFEAQIKGSEATIGQIQDQIERATITAPIDGIVGRGDLDRLIGARVDSSQALFEVLTPARLAVVHVRERDIHRVKVGQHGELVVRARSGSPIPMKVARVAPMSEVVRGENVFAVECEVLAEALELAPGMSGTARIHAGSTTLLSTIAEPLVDEARLRLWW
jgi:multidrug resistance efflux pump